jgi:hypothetical protein
MYYILRIKNVNKIDENLKVFHKYLIYKGFFYFGDIFYLTFLSIYVLMTADVLQIKENKTMKKIDPVVLLNKIDPIGLFLRLALRRFLEAELEDAKKIFLEQNIRKHRIVLWVNIGASALIVFALRDTLESAIGTVITAMIAPVMVLGGGWFAISFGCIPKELLKVAMSTTMWMFMAFMVSLSAMFISVGFVASPYFWPVLALVYIGLLISCVQYDTADGLKLGLEEAAFLNYRYGVWFYKKQGAAEEEE